MSEDDSQPPPRRAAVTDVLDSPFRTLPLDQRSERAVLALRLTAALIVTAAAVWLAALATRLEAWLFVALGLASALAWTVMVRRARARLAQADRYRLTLDPEGLRLVEGETERRVAWREVEAVETDEERLVVRVSVEGHEALLIEPRYGGLGVHDLEEVIRRALEEASRHEARSSASQDAPRASQMHTGRDVLTIARQTRRTGNG